MSVRNVIITPLRADGSPDVWRAVSVPWQGFVSLEFAEGDLLEEVALVNDQQAYVRSMMASPGELSFSAPITEEDALRVVALLCGPGLVREWQEDMADLARWADEGGYCP